MSLTIEQGPQAGYRFDLTAPVLSIGRGADNDLVLAESGASRHHARLERTSQGWQLVDLASTNGTFVNGRKLGAHEPHLLRPQDRIAIGGTVLLFQPEPAAALPHPSDDAPYGRDSRPPQRRIPPALAIVGVLVVIGALVGLVFLLVTALRPPPAPPTPTIVEPMQHMLTALPLPTGLDDLVTSVATLFPEDLLPSLLGGTPTP